MLGQPSTKVLHERPGTKAFIVDRALGACARCGPAPTLVPALAATFEESGGSVVRVRSIARTVRLANMAEDLQRAEALSLPEPSRHAGCASCRFVGSAGRSHGSVVNRTRCRVTIGNSLLPRRESGWQLGWRTVGHTVLHGSRCSRPRDMDWLPEREKPWQRSARHGAHHPKLRTGSIAGAPGHSSPSPGAQHRPKI